jgi:FkbM family methyltransferase
VTAPLGLVRWLARKPGFRRLTRVTPLLRVSFALRGALVDERLRFALNELRPRHVTSEYRLRGASVVVAIRHHTPDVLVLDEVFAQREYELPGRVVELLEGCGPGLVVADLGANIGLFGAWLLGRFSQARIVAVEADSANAAVHRRTIAANGREETWRLVEGYAAPAAGTVQFAGGLFGTSHLASEGEDGVAVPAIDVFPYLEPADFVKIDVEGGEWTLLADERFRRLGARALVLEYHREHCPEADPGTAAERSLREAGYEVLRGTRKPRAAAGLIWGYREAATGRSA